MLSKNKNYEELKSTNFKEMQVLWKSGFKKVLKIGKQTWLTKKKESKVNLNLNIK